MQTHDADDYAGLPAQTAAQLRRCQDEIRSILSRPLDTQERAYLVTMGVEDWRAEMRAIEAEGGEQL